MAPLALRTKTLSTKVSEEEYARLEELALASGQGLSEWVRGVLLAQLNPRDEILLAEILALRMLYLNTVQVLAAGRELTTEDLRKLIERVCVQ
jgi:hypothetical protein